MSKALEFAIQLGKQAGELLLGHYHSKQVDTQLKADHSAVTQADLAADHLISNAIQRAYPGELLLSEELQPTLPSDVRKIPQALWIVDPLDGTTNFSLGLHFWGVSIARLVDGWPDTAVLYFPLIDELYIAQRGQGACLNGVHIQVVSGHPQSALSFFACCSRTHRQYQVRIPYKTRILGSAAYTFCAVARGLAILGFEATPKIWDLAGAWLLVGEAGGVIETLHGNQPFPLQHDVHYSRQSYPTLAAASQQIAQRARRQILPV
jgi:myo-inositol-1(or 4)-monophosphatase